MRCSNKVVNQWSAHVLVDRPCLWLDNVKMRRKDEVAKALATEKLLLIRPSICLQWLVRR